MAHAYATAAHIATVTATATANRHHQQPSTQSIIDTSRPCLTRATVAGARYAHASDEAISLLQDMLQFEPRLRLSADQARALP